MQAENEPKRATHHDQWDREEWDRLWAEEAQAEDQRAQDAARNGWGW